MATEQKKKVYLETSFFSYLTGKKTSIALVAMRQAMTLEWWERGGSNAPQSDRVKI